jgi:filamentous hemagglutinin
LPLKCFHAVFDGVRSIWEHPDPEKLLRLFAGKGHPERGSFGTPGFKETVDFKERIGIWKSIDGKTMLPTTRGKIHYGKKGAHIVPAKPK